MKLLNLPKEGKIILVHGIIGFVLLILLFGCGNLTTLDSCKPLVGEQKAECIEKVETKQRRYSGQRDLFIGIGR